MDTARPLPAGISIMRQRLSDVEAVFIGSCVVSGRVEYALIASNLSGRPSGRPLCSRFLTHQGTADAEQCLPWTQTNSTCRGRQGRE